ncbi:MAG: anthranilate synthase/aminodeoxychorismate synthase-like glutamine amidotransferase [Saprospiraceae bacterium]|jgi:anthranilate synthase/aminodeoxychorismate synthase-like glutamine amidotransferase
MMRKISILLIDNYDSFTYNLYDYFLQIGTDCRVIRNDELSLTDFQQLSFDALVLSPGPQKPKDAGLMMSLIAYFYDKKPIFGICLGHQGLGEFFGATLRKAKLPVHGKTSTLKHNGHFLFSGLPETFKVMRYHSLIIDDFDNTPLDIIARTDNGEVMAIAHQKLPILGVQFHPESILTEHGLKILENWLSTFVIKA